MSAIANDIELEPLELDQLGEKAMLSSPWPFLGSVKVRVCVRVGVAQMSVSELLDMKQGSVFALDRLVEEPLDVLVDDHVVARGILVAVGDHFGVRITEAAVGPVPIGAPRP